MDAIILTWRWQNILSIWIMVLALALLVTLGAQVVRRVNAGSNSDGS